MMPRLRYLFLALAACLALGGCGSKKNYKYRIAVIPKGLTHEHWQSVHRGADRAADYFDKQGLAVEIQWDGPRRESDATEQIDLVGLKVGAGIDGLVLAPQDSKQMVAPVERARAEGVRVVILDSNLDKQTLRKKPDLIDKYVATDNYNGGKLAAEHLLKVLDEDGRQAPNVVLFRYAVGSESTEQREQGFLDYLDEQRKKGKKIRLLSDDKYAGATVEEAQKVGGQLLLNLQDERIDGIFAVNESSTTGLLNALREQRLLGKVHVMGFDSSKPLLQALREGNVDGLVIQDPYRMGYLGVWTLVQALEGYDVGADGKDLSTGEFIMTKKNMDDPEIREKFDPEYQAKRTIQTPKYKKK
ncbi:MAG: substrate-binding domain-containing protein [Planctomycetes bacterium]|nr:substrate-binding domain-containing protein [Planctomycetota bacterium]